MDARFIINVTVLSLQTKYRPSCFSLYLSVQERGHDDGVDMLRVLGVFCQGNLRRGFYSTKHSVRIFVE